LIRTTDLGSKRNLNVNGLNGVWACGAFVGPDSTDNAPRS